MHGVGQLLTASWYPIRSFQGTTHQTRDSDPSSSACRVRCSLDNQTTTDWGIKAMLQSCAASLNDCWNTRFQLFQNTIIKSRMTHQSSINPSLVQQLIITSFLHLVE